MPLKVEILRALTLSRVMRRSTSTLPAELQSELPACAQDCLATSIKQSFVAANCSSSTDLSCLCSQYNTEGLTLGEASLVCLNTGCSSTNLNASSSSVAYGVCSNQAKAVVATHDVLTSFQTATAQIVTTAATTQLGSSLSLQPSLTSISTHTTSARLSESSATASSPTGSVMVSVPLTSSSASSAASGHATSNNTPTPATSSSPTASPAPPNSQTSTLTSAQAVGVSIGTFGGLGMLVALIFCCVCVRRKKQEKKRRKENEKNTHHSFDFVDRSPGPYSTYPPYLYNVPLQHEAAARDQKPEQVDQCKSTPASEPNKAVLPLSLPARKAVVSDTRPTTQWPISKSKYPGVPATLNAVPACPLKASTKQSVRSKPTRPPRPDSNATTVFEEDGRSPRLRNLPSIPNSPFIPYAMTSKRPSTGPHFAEQYTISPQDMHHPSLSLEIPPMPEGDSYQNILPSPTGLTPHSPLKSASMSLPPNSAISYLPSYYTSNDSRTPVLPSRSPVGAMINDSPIPAVPVVSPAYLNNKASQPGPFPKPSTKAAHMSYASDTTFESVDPDEVTPPDEVDKRLSAVAESPLSGLRYPKVPRPSNQAIPRSPPQSRWTASSTAFSPCSEKHPASRLGFSPSEEHPPTLLSKRRGEDAAHELERQFCFSSPSGKSSLYSQTSTVHGLRIDGTGSPYKGATVLKDQYILPEMSLKSPLWEPELTPSKRGDDLFISVH